MNPSSVGRSALQVLDFARSAQKNADDIKKINERLDALAQALAKLEMRQESMANQHRLEMHNLVLQVKEKVGPFIIAAQQNAEDIRRLNTANERLADIVLKLDSQQREMEARHKLEMDNLKLQLQVILLQNNVNPAPQGPASSITNPILPPKPQD